MKWAVMLLAIGLMMPGMANAEYVGNIKCWRGGIVTGGMSFQTVRKKCGNPSAWEKYTDQYLVRGGRIYNDQMERWTYSRLGRISQFIIFRNGRVDALILDK